MPTPGLRWRHVNFHARGNWLPGDARGFRSRDHRIHSSGDYKNLPPPGEHAELHRYQVTHASQGVTLPALLRPSIGRALAWRLLHEGHRVLVASVSAHHAHLLAELPDDIKTVHDVIGRCKAKASWAVGRLLTGGVWAAGGSFAAIRTQGHQLSTFHYILEKQGPGAWTWTFRDPVPPAPRRLAPGELT